MILEKKDRSDKLISLLAPSKLVFGFIIIENSEHKIINEHIKYAYQYRKHYHQMLLAARDQFSFYFQNSLYEKGIHFYS